MRRLVELDPETKYTKEVDVKRLKREANDLKNFLLALPPSQDPLQLRQKVMPSCEAALADAMPLPLDVYNAPLNTTRMIDAGETLPEGFEELYAKFMNTATGSRGDFDHIQEKDGKFWVWVEFEI